MRTLFTPEERSTLQSFAYLVWNELADDVLAMIAEERGESEGSATVTRAEAIDMVLGTGRLASQLEKALGRQQALGKPDVSPDLIARVRTADYNTLFATVQPAFKYVQYGRSAEDGEIAA